MVGNLLIVAEKPSVARDIAAAIGEGGFVDKGGWFENVDLKVIVTHAIGHLVEIYAVEAEVKGAQLPIIPVDGFQLRPIERTKTQFDVVKKLMARNDVGVIVNACDAGREGELIFRLIYESSFASKPMKRMWLKSMMRAAIQDAYINMRPGSDYEDLADAARCRAEADWLVGINSSRAVSRAKGINLSAGRVQTPTLAMIVHRALQIETFSAQPYFEVHGRFAVGSEAYVGKWQNPRPINGDPIERCADRELAEEIQVKCNFRDPSSVTDETKPISKLAPKLYDLTTLQREANKRFGFSAKETLDLAQSLYERHKALTYPRTDSGALPEDYLEKARELVKALHVGIYAPHSERILTSDWIKPDKRIFDNSKITDHHAIIPTGRTPEGMSPAEAQLYDLVTRRFLSVFFPSAEFQATTRITVVEGERFKSSGRVLINEGWLAVYSSNPDADEEDDKEPSLCKYGSDDKVSTKSVDLKALKTSPPRPYTEASLLAAMESAGQQVDDDELAEAMKDKGLGTPATRASIIETLVSEKDGKGGAKEPYVRREKKNLIPTAKGRDLIEFLEKSAIDVLTTPATTGEWEHKLKLMESGKYRRADFMREIEEQTREIVGTIGKHPIGQLLKAPCPKCKAALVAGPRVIECEARCGFSLWKEIAKRTLSIEEAERLIVTGSIENLNGFISSKTGMPFGAGLKITEDFKAAFVFKEGVTGTALKYKCPKCRGNLLATDRTINCESDPCTFKIWKVVASRALTDGEAMTLICKGAVGPLNGFVSSKSNKKFSALLKMSHDFKPEFVFA